MSNLFAPTSIMPPPPVTPVLLLILDGFGLRPAAAVAASAAVEDDATARARKPHLDRLLRECPHTAIHASHGWVGLPEGQFGNSEVGHLNIGAGRVLLQDISKIDRDRADGTLGLNPAFVSVFADLAQSGHSLHLLGLVSDGGVHSHENHLHALIAAAHAAGVQQSVVHALLDGRDTPPRSAALYLTRLQAVCAAQGAQIASVIGRYYAMDRDQRWERIERAYRLLVEGDGLHQAASAAAALEAAYARGENDEFVAATRIGDYAGMAEGDAVIFFNFRADRARQISDAICADDFSPFARPRRPRLASYTTMTRYAAHYPFPVAYDKDTVYNSFGEYLATLGLKQLRIAETEKYPHVTYFFSGGTETPFSGEERILVPSPKVATYDLQPEMSAYEVTAQIEQAIASRRYAAIICNYANGDMVGHTGSLDAAVHAVEVLDACVGRCVKAMRAVGGEVLITADHGNCEQMWDAAHEQPHTQHTTNLVPLIYVGRPATLAAPEEGALRDIAPSLLAMMGLPIPPEMTGHSLIRWT